MESDTTEAVRIARMQVAAQLTVAYCRHCSSDRVPSTEAAVVAAYRRILDELKRQPD